MPEKPNSLSSVIRSIQDKKPVVGLTHSFYRYPARFSPKFAKATITSFTNQGDIVYDPFVGGGTTLVEAMQLGRKGIGTDVNSLAVFVSNVKTTLFTNVDITAIREWVEQAQTKLKLIKSPDRPDNWISQGYQKNFSGRSIWPIRKTIEIALSNLDSLTNNRQKKFIRCLLLKTAQWAIDCRKSFPCAQDFRKQLVIHTEEMIKGALSLRKSFQQNNQNTSFDINMLPRCLHISAQEISRPSIYPFSTGPRLILTSPPYPGVHVLYHRWQLYGRKETPAPYWIANCLDGKGASFYTFGDRKQLNLDSYFKNMRKCYQAISGISNENTWLVQLVAFSDQEWQLNMFLQILNECGFQEVLIDDNPNVTDGRSWRKVPNRKFYADHKGNTPSANEVLLVHKRAY